MNKILIPLMSMAVLLLPVSDTSSVLSLVFPVTYRVRNHIRDILIIKITIAKDSFDAFLKDKMLNCSNPLWRSKPKFSSSRSFIWSTANNQSDIVPLNASICKRVQTISSLESRVSPYHPIIEIWKEWRVLVHH